MSVTTSAYRSLSHHFDRNDSERTFCSISR